MVFRQPLSTGAAVGRLVPPDSVFCHDLRRRLVVSARRCSPVLKQAHNLFNALIALPTALATLAAPRREMGWTITSSVTSQGRQVCWRTLAPACFLIALILSGIVFTMTNGRPDRAPLFAVALLFWTAWQLITLTLVVQASIERPRQPDEETIFVDWPAVVHSSGKTWRGTANLVSLSQISLTFRDGET